MDSTLASDEMDLQLILDGMEEFLVFNSRDQIVEMRNLPPGHPLERFQEGNKLDVKKYFKEVSKKIDMIYNTISNNLLCYSS